MNSHAPFLIRIAALVLLAAPVLTQVSAEGIASMTTVTLENAKQLEHHGLAVIRRSQNGKSYIALIIRPTKGHPLISCNVRLYDKRGEKILFQIDPKIGSAPKIDGLPDGARVYFHVADDLVSDVQIRYHLDANESQSHVFTIPLGQLARIAKRKT